MPESSIPYPWHQTIWQRFLKLYEQERMPHAILLSGQEGLGKQHLANTMADLLLCQQPKSGLACGHCRSCELNHSESHPDRVTIVPEDGAKQIKIDQVRALTAFVAETAQQGGNKVVILGPLEQLNINASNALLKNLEEPTPGTFFIVYSHILSGVMATIRSRCQIMPLELPRTSESIQWLATSNTQNSDDIAVYLNLAAGAPLLAQRLLIEDKENLGLFIQSLVDLGTMSNVDLSTVQQWMEIELGDLVNWWLRLVYLSCSQKTVAQMAGQGDMQNGDLFRRVQELTQLDYNQQWLFRFSDKLMTLKRQVLQGANHNRQLLLEELLLDWHAIVKTASNDA